VGGTGHEISEGFEKRKPAGNRRAAENCREASEVREDEESTSTKLGPPTWPFQILDSWALGRGTGASA